MPERGALIDTHVFLWAILAPERLSPRASQILADGSRPLWLSLASIWEMQIKEANGKLAIEPSIEAVVSEHLGAGIVRLLPIQAKHIYALKRLPPIHRDPFDRLILAQALEEKLPVISDDAAWDGYPVARVW